MMNKFEGYLNKVDKFLAGISAFILFLMMMLIVIDVVFRNSVGFTLKALVEITGDYLMIIIVFLTLSFTHMYRDHLSVDVMMNRVPLRLRKILALLSNLIVFLLLLGVAILNFMQGMEFVKNGTVSNSVINYPMAPAIFIVSLGYFILSIRFFIDIVRWKDGGGR